MNIICIDPSLTCTALIVNDKKFVYASKHLVFTKNNNFVKWFDMVSDLITIRSYDTNINSLTKISNALTYSNEQLIKLNIYSNICADILKDILDNIDCGTVSKVYIEGYSYSSVNGPIIDLVSFGSILRYCLLYNGFTDLNIMAPQELKKMAASLAYNSSKTKSKKITYFDNEGKAAGKFDKTDMLKCLLKIDNNNDKWLFRLHDFKEQLLNMKSVPKPLEDVNDAKLMYVFVKRSQLINTLL